MASHTSKKKNADYTIDIELHFPGKGGIVIRFPDPATDPATATAFCEKAQCEGPKYKNRCWEVSLDMPPEAEYARAGTTNCSMIFGFPDKGSAEEWQKLSVLGTVGNNSEVRIKQKWEKDKIDEKIAGATAAKRRAGKPRRPSGPPGRPPSRPPSVAGSAASSPGT